ncbi:P-loop containing nucleoside triphosphate hydrolase protein [Xylaria bambusicola]|uniref:P-loop containing nucleoside triphosphate hydrolase protein n=1 Tax=Xylaria bambusicola TaxID=326684 RepID=UPI00200845F6|nr:P-loop containing nucleoside triphosphate hydrolase protein [Xylaria bambusicola]KAI0517694.1 P-loop containing nucleoside triphosphate hydrolase protein [Xylaria bambusicola]
MWSSRGLASLQKTYDESYLKCSTAVYYESQGDEKEATLCWKNALEQIRTGTASKKHGDYAPKSETERTLVQSLRELESQCKERIDLLEALRLSRQDFQVLDHAPQRQGVGQAGQDDRPSQSSTPSKGWIGDGTIPAITYTELSKPPLPQRPSLASRSSSDRAAVGRRSSIDQILDQFEATSSAQAPSLPPYSSIPSSSKGVQRSSSPDKRTMRTTLRSGMSDKSLRSTRMTPSKSSKGPGASKAATLAWSSRNSRASLDATTDIRHASPQPAELRHSHDQPRRSTATNQSYWDSHTRRLVETHSQPTIPSTDFLSDTESTPRILGDDATTAPSPLALGAASSALNALSLQERAIPNSAGKRRPLPKSFSNQDVQHGTPRGSSSGPAKAPKGDHQTHKGLQVEDKCDEPSTSSNKLSRYHSSRQREEEPTSSSEDMAPGSRQSQRKGKQKTTPLTDDSDIQSPDNPREDEHSHSKSQWEREKKKILRNLPPGIDESAAKAIFNEIVVEGDEVYWGDVAGLEVAKNALRETVVYPFLRPDLFMGLREPARGMLLFGPPGTGKTMLARAVATESKSTFFSISASSLTSKYLGDSEKLVRALFALAKTLAPSIIFVDEIDSLLSQRSGSGDHESTRRIKTEFLIQWSDLQRAAAGRESPGSTKDRGDANRVLVLAATNLPWAIDEAARRRFVRRQYIPLPEPETRATQFKTLLGQQTHNLTDADISTLVDLTDGFSGSDITALAKDAAMGPLRSLGEAVLHMTMDQIRPIELKDFRASLRTIRPSVDKAGLKEYEEWAKQFGERGG